MPNKKKLLRGARRPDLLRAAQRLFFRHHYTGTTVEQVARAAGLSKRSVYLYFKNKDELFIAVAEEGLLKLRARLEAIPLDRLDIEAAIDAIMRTYVAFAREEPRYFRMIFQEATAEMVANISPAMRRRLAEHEQACLGVVATVADKAVEQGLTPPIDRWETAVMFWGMATGIILLSLGGSQTIFGQRTREELIYKAVWILYEGLKNPAVAPKRPRHLAVPASLPKNAPRGRRKRT